MEVPDVPDSAVRAFIRLKDEHAQAVNSGYVDDYRQELSDYERERDAYATKARVDRNTAAALIAARVNQIKQMVWERWGFHR